MTNVTTRIEDAGREEREDAIDEAAERFVRNASGDVGVLLASGEFVNHVGRTLPMTEVWRDAPRASASDLSDVALLAALAVVERRRAVAEREAEEARREAERKAERAAFERSEAGRRRAAADADFARSLRRFSRLLSQLTRG